MTFLSPMKTVPQSGVSSPAITRSSVDLPLPLGPSSAVSDPVGTSTDTSSSATKSPKLLRDVANRDRHQTRLLSWLDDRASATRTTMAIAASVERDAVDAGGVEVLVVVLHAQRRGLRLALDVPGDDGDRAVLAEAARRREHDAVDDRPADRRQRDPPERLPARGAEGVRRLLLLVADLAQRRDRPRGRRTGPRRRPSRARSTAARTAPGSRGSRSQAPNQPVRP